MTTPSSKDKEQHHEAQALMMGNLSDDQVLSVKARAIAHNTQHAQSEREKRKQQTYDLLIQSLYQQIDQLNRDIANMEAGFEAEFGDAWREEIALRILSPDDFPQQMKDENLADYRERLEEQLVDEMLNPDGTIKEKYKNDPQMVKYAEWAQSVYNRDKAVEMANDIETDPNSPAIQQLEQKRNSDLTLNVADQLEGHEKQADVLKTDNELYVDATHNQQANFSNDFLKPIV